MMLRVETCLQLKKGLPTTSAGGHVAIGGILNEHINGSHRTGHRHECSVLDACKVKWKGHTKLPDYRKLGLHSSHFSVT